MRCGQWCCGTWSWPTTCPSPGCEQATPPRRWKKSMESDTAERALKFWAKVMLLALAVDLILLAVDHKLKNDVIKESRALRELIGREQQMRRQVADDILGRGPGPAGQADRGGGEPGPVPVVPVADDPGAPPEAVADGGAGGPAGAGRPGRPPPPRRGQIGAARLPARGITACAP